MNNDGTNELGGNTNKTSVLAALLRKIQDHQADEMRVLKDELRKTLEQEQIRRITENIKKTTA